jgi:hypothetical protein
MESYRKKKLIYREDWRGNYMSWYVTMMNLKAAD